MPLLQFVPLHALWPTTLHLTRRRSVSYNAKWNLAAAGVNGATIRLSGATVVRSTPPTFAYGSTLRLPSVSVNDGLRALNGLISHLQDLDNLAERLRRARFGKRLFIPIGATNKPKYDNTE
jgi:hypothetical protein